MVIKSNGNVAPLSAPQSVPSPTYFWLKTTLVHSFSTISTQSESADFTVSYGIFFINKKRNIVDKK